MRKKALGKIILAATIGVAGIGGSIAISAPSAYAQEVADKTQFENKAKELIDLAFKGQWDSAYKLLDEKLQAVLPKELLQSYWTANTGNFGAVKSTELKETKYNGVHTRVVFNVTAEASPYQLYFNFDEDGKIDDFAVNFPEYPYSNPSYYHPENFTEKDIIIGEGDFALPGVLTVPKGEGPFPVVVLVHGSGAHDMDESYLGFKPLKDIAVGLANEGIAVLRYEKRTFTHPVKTGTNPKLSIQEETVLDANIAVKKLKTVPEIDAKNIFVLGHSQGGFALPYILENDKDGDIKGGIVAAGPANKFQDLLLWQNEQSLKRAQLANAPKEQIDALEANLAFWKEQVGLINNPQYTAENPPPNFKLGMPYWWFGMRDYTAPEASKKQSVPLFVFQGNKDFQVSAEQLNVWKSALKERDNVAFKLYPNMHHFLAQNPKATGTEIDYMTPGNVSETLITDLAQWVKTGEVEQETTAPTVPEVNLPQYNDYQDDQYWSKPFSWAIQEGYIKGYQNEKLLKPNSALNESQFLTVFFRYALGDSLKDESIKTIYALAKEKGLPVKGKAFAELSRGEAAVLLAQIVTNQTMTQEEVFQWLQANNMLEGILDGQEFLQLDAPITRGQFVTILHRIHEANLLGK